MAELTMEQAIALRDTISEPRYIINNLLYNEGMKMYINMACGKILELVDQNLEYQKDIFLNIMDWNVEVTVFGFLLIKSIMLSYISEERYEEYLYYLRLKNEQVQTWNDMINLLRGFSNKQLHSLKKEVKGIQDIEERERMRNYVLCELKARSLPSLVSNWYHKQKQLFGVHIRGYRISQSLKKSPIQSR